jgi:hypothetical protein
MTLTLSIRSFTLALEVSFKLLLNISPQVSTDVNVDSVKDDEIFPQINL